MLGNCSAAGRRPSGSDFIFLPDPLSIAVKGGGSPEGGTPDCACSAIEWPTTWRMPSSDFRRGVQFLRVPGTTAAAARLRDLHRFGAFTHGSPADAARKRPSGRTRVPSANLGSADCKASMTVRMRRYQGIHRRGRAHPEAERRSQVQRDARVRQGEVGGHQPRRQCWRWRRTKARFPSSIF